MHIDTSEQIWSSAIDQNLFEVYHGLVGVQFEKWS